MIRTTTSGMPRRPQYFDLPRTERLDVVEADPTDNRIVAGASPRPKSSGGATDICNRKSFTRSTLMSRNRPSASWGMGQRPSVILPQDA
jgi:hypothetical protein